MVILRGAAGHRAARLLTDVVSPAPVVGVVVVLVAAHSARSARQAVELGIIAACFGSVLPLAFILYQVHSRRVTDIHVGDRRQRPLIMLVTLVLALIGVALMLWVGITRALLATVIAGVTGIVVCLLITVRWKVSIHLAVLGGACVLLADALTHWVLLALVVTLPLGWARVRLGDHTVGQVTAGALTGAAIAAIVYPLMLRVLP